VDAPPRIAAIADVHGNVWALDAVLADVRRRDITSVVNLGDSVLGPLDPAGTAARLMEWKTVNVCGNDDRAWLAAHAPERESGPAPAGSTLTPGQVQWLRRHLPTYESGDLLCCHGTPGSDETYLLEDVTPHGVRLADAARIESKIMDVRQAVVLCAHSHMPRTVRLLNGRVIVNPGSVGLPAYASVLPYPHAMEAGSPHARYAVLTKHASGYTVDHIAVPYPWDTAADAARRNGRPDWAAWLQTGRAVPP
jgi:predicted phosphodiesterase